MVEGRKCRTIDGSTHRGAIGSDGCQSSERVGLGKRFGLGLVLLLLVLVGLTVHSGRLTGLLQTHAAGGQA